MLIVLASMLLGDAGPILCEIFFITENTDFLHQINKFGQAKIKINYKCILCNNYLNCLQICRTRSK